VFNLEEFMNSEFLRPRENSCKWFIDSRVMRRIIYIVRGDKTKILHKINIVNRFKEMWIDSPEVRDLDEWIQCVLNQFEMEKDELRHFFMRHKWTLDQDT